MRKKNSRSMTSEQKRSARTDWIWEFSKRVVVMLTAAYFIVVLYAAYIMAATGNLDSLTQLISDNADVLKVCVFGYFVKAGVENSFKIRLNRNDSEQNDTETEG